MRMASATIPIGPETRHDTCRTKTYRAEVHEMRRGIAILAAAALALAAVGPAMARQPTYGAVAGSDYSYFDSHPDVARKLAKDPTLIDNQQFVDAHPDLHEYLHNHPN